jgi:hypothetical protein
MQIKVFARLVYGRPMIYPACDAAKALAAFANVRTFNQSQLDTLGLAGVTVEQVADPRTAITLAKVAS